MTDLSNWNVLLVDDEQDAQDILVPILRHHGITVQAAFTAEEAIRLMLGNPPTVVITDLALPDLSGWDLLDRMRAEPALAQIPAVAITAYHSNSVAQEALEAGFAAYFPKPIDAYTFVEDLIRLIN